MILVLAAMVMLLVLASAGFSLYAYSVARQAWRRQFDDYSLKH